MKDSEYIETVTVLGKEIKIGMDDYGQCYFFEYVDDDGTTQCQCCGTYNTDYLEEVYDFFDHKGTAISIWGQDEWENGTLRIIDRFEKKAEQYKNDPEELKIWQKWFIDLMRSRANPNYELYNFEQMYEERRRK